MSIAKVKPISNLEKVQESRLELVREQFLQDNAGLFTYFWQFKNLEGRLLSLIEGLGLNEKQESVAKSYVTREVWATIHETYLVSEEAKEYLCKVFIARGK